jgi:hypothetical protein
MRNQFTAIARVKDATLDLSQGQRENLARFLKHREGKFVQLTLREQGRPRSNNQNRYYWSMIVGMIAEEIGDDSEAVHSALKWKFLPRQFITLAGEEIEVPKSTTQLSTNDFEIYLEQVRAFAATELSLAIPLPHET